jgi:hypothetical protein
MIGKVMTEMYNIQESAKRSPTTRVGLDPAADYRIKVGQRFHQVGYYTAVTWQAMSVYRDAQGHEHATLVDEAGCRDKKTLSASVLLDRSQYQLI